MELAILAAEVKQGVAARFEDRLQDAPDEDEMIPARMHRLARALKAAQRAVQDRRAEFPDLPRGRGKTVLSPSGKAVRSEEHTSELQSLMRISYAVFCLKKKTIKNTPKQIEEMTRTSRETNVRLHD